MHAHFKPIPIVHSSRTNSFWSTLNIRRMQPPSPSTPRALFSKIEDVLPLSVRSTGLVQSNHERPKIALRKSRWRAGIRCLVHALPLAAAVILLYLNLSNYYVGSTFSQESQTALQFAAKLHEVLMVASITTVALSYLYWELSSTGIPFGLAFAGLEVTKLSYLFSSEFLGSIQSRQFSFWHKARLILTITFTTALVATVGPSSAATMIPRRGYWPYVSRARRTMTGAK